MNMKEWWIKIKKLFIVNDKNILIEGDEIVSNETIEGEYIIPDDPKPFKRDYKPLYKDDNLMGAQVSTSKSQVTNVAKEEKEDISTTETIEKSNVANPVEEVTNTVSDKPIESVSSLTNETKTETKEVINDQPIEPTSTPSSDSSLENVDALDNEKDDEPTQEQEINPEKDKATKQRAILIKPRYSKEAKAIAQRLMENNIVVLNLESVSDLDFERIKDFVSGTLFSLNGSYRKVSKNIAVLLPSKNIDEGYLKLVLKKVNDMR